MADDVTNTIQIMILYFSSYNVLFEVMATEYESSLPDYTGTISCALSQPCYILNVYVLYCFTYMPLNLNTRITTILKVRYSSISAGRSTSVLLL